MPERRQALPPDPHHTIIEFPFITLIHRQNSLHQRQPVALFPYYLDVSNTLWPIFTDRSFRFPRFGDAFVCPEAERTYAVVGVTKVGGWIEMGWDGIFRSGGWVFERACFTLGGGTDGKMERKVGRKGGI